MKKSKSLQALIRRERARGRAEAVNIIARICPEDGIDGLIRSSPNGESGDYSSYWDVDALRKLLCADTEACDVIDRLRGAHEFTHYLKHDLAKACEALTLAQTDASRFNCIAEDMLSDLARRYGNDVSDDLEDVLKALDAAVAVKSQRPAQVFYPTPANLECWRAISE
ncbi:hypothetical protein [Pseudomonas sp. UMAB-40]|uniref:hypothetical protein n=1 Tax=Pseudomonas sp. UMAB-40 TaxID=1365407 RepID=UPI001C55B0D2|nr:hypothetical protein [Pseudomonas sp. UMAB-40]